jgi:hypothetical protein
MKYVAVTFGENPREYTFQTQLVLEPQEDYYIVADDDIEYSTHVTIQRYVKPEEIKYKGVLREITAADLAWEV